MTNEERFNSNIKIAYKIANRYAVNYIKEIEDIKQVALMGLWKAVLNYKGKYTFCTFAYKVISNEINYYLRKNKKQSLDISMNSYINRNQTIEETLQDNKDYIEELENEIEINEIRKIKEQEVAKMPNHYQQAYKLLEKGVTQKEIEKRLGVKQTVVSRMQRKLIQNVCKQYVKV